MKNDDLHTVFKNMEGSFDLQDTPLGHRARFMERLRNASEEDVEIETTPVRSITQHVWWKAVAMTAAVVAIMVIGFQYTPDRPQEADLASVSEEMRSTQSFFTTAINKEIETLKAFSTPQSEALVADALKKIDQLESEYNHLKKDLVTSGNDKRVVYAMISNFQTRIELLTQVVETLKNLEKSNNYENLL
ncbi:MAG: hypothetical protein HKM28_04205 [Flavobacteriaceae bacterium]|nr:hypothetical protein [Flavobacteriaceae bacterium]